MQSPRGAWLFPAIYAVHILEELFAVGGFVAWADRALGIPMSMGEFVGWNALALALLCIGAVLVVRDARLRWIEIAVAVAVTGNAAAHLIASVATWSWSPGLVSGALLWGPLGIIRGTAAWRVSSRRGRLAGVLIGSAAVLVTMGVLLSGLW